MVEGLYQREARWMVGSQPGIYRLHMNKTTSNGFTDSFRNMYNTMSKLTWCFFIGTQCYIILINAGEHFNDLAMHTFLLQKLNLI